MAVYTKEQIAKGIAKFIKNDMIPNTPDMNMRIALRFTSSMMEVKPSIANFVFDHKIMSAFKIDDNTFDIDTNILAQSFGGDKFTIPLPPLLSDKKLYIGAEDIEKISQYIGG